MLPARIMVLAVASSSFFHPSAFIIPNSQLRPSLTPAFLLNDKPRFFPVPLALLPESGTEDVEIESPPQFSEIQDEDDVNGASITGVDDDSEGNQECPSTGKSILSIAVPALAALAIDPLMTLADTVFVGRTADNASALAGMGSAAALLTFSFYLFNFLCTVTTPLVSQRRAAEQEDEAIKIGGQALSLAILLGTILSSVLITFSQPLLEVMGTGDTGVDANTYAMSFLGIRAFAAPAIFFTSASTGILRGFLDTKTTFVILLGSNIINCVLDIVLIYWLKMGPTGAAIATTSAEWVCAIFLFLVLSAKIPSIDGMLGSNQGGRRASGDSSTPLIQNLEMIVIKPVVDIPSWGEIQPLLVASATVFVRSFVLQLSIAGAAAMAARDGGGESELASSSIAAHQIALQLWLLCSFVCDALAAASQTLVADRLGREDEAGVRDVSKIVFAYSLGLGLLLSIILGMGDITGFLLNLFTKDIQTQQALKPLLTILIIAQPLNSFVFAADGVLQGASEFSYQAKSMVFSASVCLLSFFCFQHLSGGEEVLNNNLQNIWFSLVILQVMRGLTSMWKLIDSEGPVKLFSE